MNPADEETRRTGRRPKKTMEKAAGIIEDVSNVPATAASAVSWHVPRGDPRLCRPFPDDLRCANFSDIIFRRDSARDNQCHDCAGRYWSACQLLPGSTRAMQIGVIVAFWIANIEDKYPADIAGELFHHSETFRAAQWKFFRIPLSLCASDRTDACFEHPCFCPDRIILGKFRLLVRHAWISAPGPETLACKH